VPSVPTLDSAWRAEFGINGWLHNLEKPTGQRLLAWDDIRSARSPVPEVLYIKGDVLTVNCWRQTLNRTNPNHLLQGYTRLLQAAVDGEITRRTRRLAAIIFHQCPGGPHGVPRAWEFGSAVWRIVERHLLSVGLVDASTSLFTLSQPSTYNARQARKGPGAGDVVLCAQNLHTGKPSFSQVGRMNEPVLRAWRSGYVAEYNSRLPAGSSLLIDADPETRSDDVTRPSPRVTARMLPAAVGNTSSCGGSCSRQLRVMLWQRSASSQNGRRLLFKESAIARLVAEISDIPMVVRVPSESMSWSEQVRLVRSADIIMTAHSSALANVAFADTATAIIELGAIHVDGSFCTSGTKLVRGYLMSYGHMPLERTRGKPSGDAVPDFGLIKAMDRCHYDKSATFKCPSTELKASDLLISTERLRADLRAAATILCSCSTEESKALQRLADKGCFGNVPLRSARSRRFQYGDAKWRHRGRAHALIGVQHTRADS